MQSRSKKITCQSCSDFANLLCANTSGAIACLNSNSWHRTRFLSCLVSKHMPIVVTQILGQIPFAPMVPNQTTAPNRPLFNGAEFSSPLALFLVATILSALAARYFSV